MLIIDLRKTDDTDELIEGAKVQGIQTVIPPKSHRKTQREFDKDPYIENAFVPIKRWRGIATTYAKNSASCLGAIQIPCLANGRISHDAAV